MNLIAEYSPFSAKFSKFELMLRHGAHQEAVKKAASFELYLIAASNASFVFKSFSLKMPENRKLVLRTFLPQSSGDFDPEAHPEFKKPPDQSGGEK